MYTMNTRSEMVLLPIIVERSLESMGFCAARDFVFLITLRFTNKALSNNVLYLYYNIVGVAS